jgi:peroxiredoxin Q/BCP
MKYLDIKLEASDDQTYSLRDFKGQKLVLYFYPKDNTSGCTLEAKSFTSLQKEYLDKGYRIVGVSRDGVASHKSFISKQELNLLLLSDKQEELVKAFDVLKEKTMYGRKYIGIVKSTFLLDENGDITQEFRNVKAKGHAESVLQSI